jgi:hypothetical protein
VLLLVREHRKQDGRPGGVTEPFRCLGVATDESHEAERIWFGTEWRSRLPLAVTSTIQLGVCCR